MRALVGVVWIIAVSLLRRLELGKVLRQNLLILGQQLVELNRGLIGLFEWRRRSSIDSFIALASPRRASLRRRQAIASSAATRRVLPFSVTSIICRKTSFRMAPTLRLPFRRPVGLPLLPGGNCVPFGGRP